MSKINNITAYATTTPTATTILIGSEDSGGATKNYLVSALATYMSSNITTLTDLTLSGFLTVGGATTLNGNLIANGATTLADTTVSSTLDVTGATTLSSTLDVTGDTSIGGNTSITGTFNVIGNTTIGAGTANSLLVLGGLTSTATTALADTTVSSTLDVTGATTLSSTLDVTGDSQFGGQLLVSGLLQVGSFTMTSSPIFFNGINAGGTSNLGTSAFADNAAAVAGGLSVNDVYRTDGTGAAPLNVAGILMVRV